MSNLKKIFTSVLIAIGIAKNSTTTLAEELSVATFIPPQHHINAFFVDWFGKKLGDSSDGSLQSKIYPEGQVGEGTEQQ